MTKKLLWLGLKFVAITGPVTWWWMYGGGQDAYWDFYREIAFPILAKMGVTTFPPGLVRDRLLNFLPFVALMMITPGLSPRLRYGGLAGGLVVIFAGQVLLAWWAYWTHERSGAAAAQAMADFFPALILTDALPFVVWAVLANQVLLGLLAQILPPLETAPTASAYGGEARAEGDGEGEGEAESEGKGERAGSAAAGRDEAPPVEGEPEGTDEAVARRTQ